MYRSFVLFLAALILAGLAGCGSVGRDFDKSHVEDIHNNITSKTMIQDWFGEPHAEGKQNGMLMWTYQYDRYSAFGEDQSKELVLLFGDDDRVKAYRYSSNIDEEEEEEE